MLTYIKQEAYYCWKSWLTYAGGATGITLSLIGLFLLNGFIAHSNHLALLWGVSLLILAWKSWFILCVQQELWAYPARLFHPLKPQARQLVYLLILFTRILAPLALLVLEVVFCYSPYYYSEALVEPKIIHFFKLISSGLILQTLISILYSIHCSSPNPSERTTKEVYLMFFVLFPLCYFLPIVTPLFLLGVSALLHRITAKKELWRYSRVAQAFQLFIGIITFACLLEFLVITNPITQILAQFPSQVSAIHPWFLSYISLMPPLETISLEILTRLQHLESLHPVLSSPKTSFLTLNQPAGVILGVIILHVAFIIPKPFLKVKSHELSQKMVAK